MLKKLLTVVILWLVVAAPASAAPPVILILGDSLSSGYGLPLRDGWVALLEQRLANEKFPHKVVNASITGDTTRSGRARLPRALDQHKPAVVVLELGGNDGLRGLPLSQPRENLAAMIALAQKQNAKVLLVGMRIPSNYGTAYTEGFHNLYAELGKRYRIPVVPFFLDGVATVPGMMQSDGLHPSKAAQPKMLANLWPYLEPLLSVQAKAQ